MTMMLFETGEPDRRRQRERPRQACAAAYYRRAAAVAAEVFGVSVADVLSLRRRKGVIARARQLAVYLTVVVYGLPRRRVARLSGRDAMDVSRACTAMEAARDDQDFDQLLSLCEARLRG